MLIMDAVECRSQLMSKVTSIWLSGVPVGAEKFRFCFRAFAVNYFEALG